MAEERAKYRWWVLLNTFLTFTIAFGMGWTYIVMVASEVIKDLGLTIVAWGTLWSAVSLGALLFAILVEPWAIALVLGLLPGWGLCSWGPCCS